MAVPLAAGIAAACSAPLPTERTTDIVQGNLAHSRVGPDNFTAPSTCLEWAFKSNDVWDMSNVYPWWITGERYSFNYLDEEHNVGHYGGEEVDDSFPEVHDDWVWLYNWQWIDGVHVDLGGMGWETDTTWIPHFVPVNGVFLACP